MTESRSGAVNYEQLNSQLPRLWGDEALQTCLALRLPGDLFITRHVVGAIG